MIKKILFLALFSMLALSACKGSGDSSSARDDDCEENMADCMDVDPGTTDDAGAE